MEYKIVLIKVEKRTSSASEVQKILTDYGSNIRVRLGLHDCVDNNNCSSCGLIFLEICGDEAVIGKMIDALNVLKGISVKYLKI
ncbi:MAG: hypothetical protein FWF38_01290 [Spirochaetaceae bacterium]|nr:hypothetical protein [Spirochaetaceae bacterium]